MKVGSDLQALNASFEAFSEQTEFETQVTKMKPLAQLEVVQLYGEKEAEKVMAHKEMMNLTQDDPNLPGKKLYLMRGMRGRKEQHT